MIRLQEKNKEIDIKLEYSDNLGALPKVYIEGTGDLDHHLIEGLFNIVDKLSKMEGCSHRSEEWK